MNIHQFIFSNKPSFRLCRHFLFWTIFFVQNFVVWSSFYFSDPANSSTTLTFSSVTIIKDLKNADFSIYLNYTINNTLLIILFSYTVAYFLIPKFLMRGRARTFASWLIVLTLTCEIIRIYYSGFRSIIGEDLLLMFWFGGISFVSGGPLIYCGLFITIKVLKTWHVVEEEKLTLIKENSSAELQLLKAQVHPHFLFNTLNNIYSFSLSQSSKAPDLVQKLSDVMKYMINDCEASLVSAEKEMKLIEDYVGLEQVRYGSRLSLSVNIKGDTQCKFITPLLLIPLIENSFKHGTSKMLTNSWIKLNIDLSDETLHFTLSNSKPVYNEEKIGNKGIGLSNVRKRLQLLYPNQHDLTLESEKESFTVKLDIPLHAYLKQPDSNRILSVESTEPAYVGA